ncbi:MAG: sigma-70 family RNA polymerase sigma factor [Ruminococcus sp.]|nr:sigma-70 family RNA polymerase sigma factor [Ruminococcus sp.]
MTGSELKALFRKSPLDAQQAFYDEYKNYVYTIVYSRLRSYGSKEDTEECVSDVFADIFLDIERFFEMDDLSGMTGLIAKRKAVQFYRRLSSGYENDSGGYEMIADAADVAADAENRQRCSEVLSKINELGEPDSTIILMSCWYEMNSFQIGKRLSMKPATVRKRLQRALERLRKLMAEIGYDERE